MNTDHKPDFLLTKIIATLGPASASLDIIQQLILEGVRVFRINFSHGTFSEYDSLIKNIRQADKITGKPVAIMGDLSGPKIRLGKVIDGGWHLLENQKCHIVRKEIVTGTKGNENLLTTNFPSFIEEVLPGEKILLDDGNVELEVEQKTGKGKNAMLECRVVVGGVISTAKGVNLPDTELSAEALSKKDKECVDYAISKKLDYLALSFVRKVEDVRKLKNYLKKVGARPKETILSSERSGTLFPRGSMNDFVPIITKIEKPQAIHNLVEIVKETDGIMVARGDLGVEMDLAEVAILQKKIIRLCQEYGKPVIVATQMLQSMITSSVPTRAEVSDVANAIFDGTDAVMLSGETAIGKYPVKAVTMMSKIASKTNSYLKQNDIFPGTAIINPDLSARTTAIATAVKNISINIKPKFIVVWTNWGGSAVYLSQQRLPIPLFAFTEDKRRLRMLNLLYGVEPMFMKQPTSGTKFIRAIDELLLGTKIAKENDPVVIVSGDPINRTGLANRIVIHHVGEGAD